MFVQAIEELMENVSPTRSSIIPTVRDIEPEEPGYQCMDDVRIIPAKMVFRDVYDGKNFNQSITIINAGTYPALVRVFTPTSNAFRMKPLPRGCYLPSGMSITRKIYYRYTRVMALPRACLPIYINEKPIIYQIEV